MPLSVIIHTKNAAETIVQALSSVAFADEIIVVDMESSDETRHLAKKHGAKVVSHPDVGFADPARNFGLEQARHDWILVLDADEEVPSQLRSFVQQVLEGEVDPELQASAYYLPRKNIIFNQWLAHTGWWPDYQLRLFKKGTVTWQAGVHRLPDATVKPLELPSTEEFALLHHNYQTISQFIERLNRYTTIKANESANEIKVVTTLDAAQVMTAFGNEFMSRFFAHQGSRDGVHGLSLSLLQATYELVVVLKRWEQAGFPDEKTSLESIKAVSQFNSNLRYWLADWQVQHTSGPRKWWWQLRRKYHW